MQSWLELRNRIGKGAQATGMTTSLRIPPSKADSNTWESFTRSGLKLESVHQESPRSDVFTERATKPIVKQKQRQKHLTWATEKRNELLLSDPKSSFQIKVHFAFNLENQDLESGRLERHRIQAAWSPVWSFPKSEMIWGAVTSADVGPLCFIKSNVNAAVCQEIFAHFMLPSADKLYGDADFHFQQDFSTCPQCQNHFQMVFLPGYYCALLASQHA